MFVDKQLADTCFMNDVTLYVNMITLTVEDRLLIKTSQTEKNLDC